MKALAEAESRPPVYTGRWAHASPEEVKQEKTKVSVSWLIVCIYPRMYPLPAWGKEIAPQALVFMEVMCVYLHERWVSQPGLLLALCCRERPSATLFGCPLQGHHHSQQCQGRCEGQHECPGRLCHPAQQHPARLQSEMA